jgi:alpha-L-fucosidase 2
MVETDGDVERGTDKLSVDDATTATLYITAATNFVNYKDVSGNPVTDSVDYVGKVKGVNIVDGNPKIVAEYNGQTYQVAVNEIRQVADSVL